MSTELAHIKAEVEVEDIEEITTTFLILVVATTLVITVAVAFVKQQEDSLLLISYQVAHTYLQMTRNT